MFVECCRKHVVAALRTYRLIILPVVDTWMSWSLLRKLTWSPGVGTILLLGVLVVTFIALGVQVRAPHIFLWHSVTTSPLLCEGWRGLCSLSRVKPYDIC